MKIFLPFKRPLNKYLDEIEQYFQGTFHYGNISSFNSSYEIVNIHWPEKLFEWNEPTKKQLEELENELIKWKQFSTIIYTRHNIHPHNRNTNNFKKLYEIVEKFADGIIHLGAFELKKFENLYPLAKHKIIKHPLYLTIPNQIARYEARKELNISKNKRVVLVFGSIRSIKEERMILNSFKRLKTKNKLLMIPKMPFFSLKYENSNISSHKLNGFRRKFLKKYFSISSMYYFKKNGFINNDEIQLYLNASDILFIARENTLNSGNIFLGYTFKKIMVGPDFGNIGEELKINQFPTFHFNNQKSILKALKSGLKLKNKIDDGLNYPVETKKYHPKVIAEQYLHFFKEVRIS